MHTVFAAVLLLTGIHTVYVDADVRSRHEIALALKRELPQVRVVSRSLAADATIELRATGFAGGARSTLRPAQPPATVMVTVGGHTEEQPAPIQYQHTPMTVLSEPSTVYLSAVMRFKDGKEVPLYDGLDSPSFATRTAAQFIKTWREANP
jgi:hypothetical protein